MRLCSEGECVGGVDNDNDGVDKELDFLCPSIGPIVFLFYYGHI